MTQPALNSAGGVVLTIGMLSGGDRCSLVLPIATDSSAAGPITLCYLAVESVKANLLPSLLDCFGTEGEVTFLQGEGMASGTVPYREDFTSGTYVGTQGGGKIPSNCGLLIACYEEPADIVPDHKIRVAHNTIPGQSPDNWPDGTADSAIITAGETFAGKLLTGWRLNPVVGSDSFYRVLAAKRGTSGTGLDRIAATNVRGYVGTQRRRLVPH